MTVPMDGFAALRRIAFLLERRMAPSYRVKAFRTAALAIATLPAAELHERVLARTLTDLPGVGPKTAAVVEEAAAGLVPQYLADLEQTAGPLASGGEEIRAALRGDLHSHSDWSDGGSPIEEMAMTAVEIGHDYQALTDHSPRLTVANGLTAKRLEKQLTIVAALNKRLGSFRLLSGIECDINEDGTLDQTDDLLGRVDIVVASVHSKLRSESAVMTKRMLAALDNPYADVLGHCTGRLVTGGRGTRPPSAFEARKVFARAAERGVAIEINSRPERLDPPRDLLKRAVDAGCLFSIDTDAHAPGQLDFQAYGCVRAAECGVPVERIVNTWPLEQLLAWTTRSR
jgi:putative hydrolase